MLRKHLLKWSIGRRLFVEKKVVRTSWNFRLLGLALLVAALLIPGKYWLSAAAMSLVHTGPVMPAEVILVDPLETHYIIFDRAARLYGRGFGSRFIAPVVTPGAGPQNPGDQVAIDIANLLARTAGIHDPEVITIRDEEPITLNAAIQIRDYLLDHRIGSAVMVTTCFRSQRTFEVYHSVFEPCGLRFSCEPVCGDRSPENWTSSLHGLQEVALELWKLWYYRLWVLWGVEGTSK